MQRRLVEQAAAETSTDLEKGKAQTPRENQTGDEKSLGFTPREVFQQSGVSGHKADSAGPPARGWRTAPGFNFRMRRDPAAIRRLRAGIGSALLITAEGPNARRRESIHSEDCRTGVSRVEQQVLGRLRY